MPLAHSQTGQSSKQSNDQTVNQTTEHFPQCGRIIGHFQTQQTFSVSAINERFVATAFSSDQPANQSIYHDEDDDRCYGVLVKQFLNQANNQSNSQSDDDEEDDIFASDAWELIGHRDPITCCKFSNNQTINRSNNRSDDQSSSQATNQSANLLITCSTDCIIVWNLDEAAAHFNRANKLYRFQGRVLDQQYDVYHLYINQSNNQIALCCHPSNSQSKFHDVVVIDLNSGAEVAVFQGHDQLINDLLFVSESDLLINQSFNQAISQSISSPVKSSKSIPSPSRPIKQTIFPSINQTNNPQAIQPTNQTNDQNVQPSQQTLLVSVSSDRTFKIWSLSSFALLYDSWIVSSAPLTNLSINRSNGRLIVGSIDGIIRFIDVKQSINQSSKQSLSTNNQLSCTTGHTINLSKWVDAREKELKISQSINQSMKDQSMSRKIVRAPRDTVNQAFNHAINQINGFEEEEDDDQSNDGSIISLSVISGSDNQFVNQPTNQTNKQQLHENNRSIKTAPNQSDSHNSNEEQKVQLKLPSIRPASTGTSISQSNRQQAKSPIKQPTKIPSKIPIASPSKQPASQARPQPSPSKQSINRSKNQPKNEMNKDEGPSADQLSDQYQSPYPSDSLLIVTRRCLAVLSLNTLSFTHFDPFQSNNQTENQTDDENELFNLGLISSACCSVITSSDPSISARLVTSNPFQKQLSIVDVGQSINQANNQTNNHSTSRVPLDTRAHIPVSKESFLNKYQFKQMDQSTKQSNKPAAKKAVKPSSTQPISRSIKSSGYGTTHAKIKLGEMPHKIKHTKDEATKQSISQLFYPSWDFTLPLAADPSFSRSTTSSITQPNNQSINPVHNSGVVCMDCAFDGRIISGSLDGTVSIFKQSNKQSINPVVNFLSGHSGAITCVAINQSIKQSNNQTIDADLLIASASVDGTVRIYQSVNQSMKSEPCITIDNDHGSSNNQATSQTIKRFDSPISSLSFFAGNRFVILTHRNQLIAYKYSIDQSNNQSLNQSKARAVFNHSISQSHSITSHAGLNTPAASTLMVATGARSVIALDCSTSQSIWSSMDAHDRSIYQIELFQSNNQSMMLTNSHDQSIKLWDLRLGQSVMRMTGHSNRTIQCRLSINQSNNQSVNQILMGSEDGFAYVYDLRTGRCQSKFGEGTTAVSDAVIKQSNKQSTILLGDYQGQIKGYTYG